jgi:7-carboxy-7-deazaguanine synthase (Cx14CxxC type)
MNYTVKEIFYTLQGEGANAGRPAVFCRFTGCNLWSGRPQDLASAVCRFCDTDFVGVNGPRGGKFSSPRELAQEVADLWPRTPFPCGRPFVVCTGGEPLLQLDEELVVALHDQGFEVAIETNGTRPAPPGIDWICVSPKADSALAQKHGQELKLVYPQAGVDPERFAALDFEHFFLQPMDGPDRDAATLAAVAYCLANPRWRLSVQTHKYLGLP